MMLPSYTGVVLGIGTIILSAAFKSDVGLTLGTLIMALGLILDFLRKLELKDEALDKFNKRLDTMQTTVSQLDRKYTSIDISHKLNRGDF